MPTSMVLPGDCGVHISDCIMCNCHVIEDWFAKTAVNRLLYVACGVQNAAVG